MQVSHGARSIGNELGWITSASINVLKTEVDACDLTASLNDFKDSKTLIDPEVVLFSAFAWELDHAGQCLNMGSAQIVDVNVVAYASAIASRKVIAKHL